VLPDVHEHVVAFFIDGFVPLLRVFVGDLLPDNAEQAEANIT